MFLWFVMSKAVLLVGVDDDPVLVYVSHYLVKFGVPVIWLDQNQMGKNLLCNQKGWVSAKNEKLIWQVDHTDIVAVYNRIAGLNYKQSTNAQIVAFECLIYLLNNVYPNVVNKPKSSMTNFAKLSQLLSLKKYDFVIPNSSLRVFLARDFNSYIYKSASSYRSIVKKYKQNNIVGAEPVLYQQLLAGTNYRVHVFAQNCFAVKVKAKTIDYRYCQYGQFKVAVLPEFVQKICRDITRNLGLVFSGVDLIHFNDKWYLLEVNSAPGFNFFESKVNNNILMLEISKYFFRLAA